jgi:acetyl-CoA carboxylase biotin carboxylase subunit
MKTRKIKKVLIANRGEIAVRITNTLRRQNIKAVAVFSEHDSQALHVHMANEAYSLGQGDLLETYLNVDKIIRIAQKTGADAIHPGYGFLSENPVLVKACEEHNIVFIGPQASTMQLMGNKIAARKFAIEQGLPVTKGITGTKDEILKQANTIPFPVLVKAAAGGGGKGMRIVREVHELEVVLESTSREAANYFGDGTVYLEQYIEQPRHIEVQVLGDQYGNVIHLFERECTIQRRYQKIIEESPSATLTPEIRQQMGEAAVALCKAIGYRSAGTIEFLVDQHLHYYFLEMNTRIQVEHPVTEMVTGIDLVEEQLYIAMGHPLRIAQEDVVQNGHAIECRIYAEDPANNFLPSPGKISLYVEPELDDVRIDSSMDAETEVLSFFDPMISKLIAWGETREQAIETAKDALQQYAIHGISTNITYLKLVLEHPLFISNQISTDFCDQHTAEMIKLAKTEKDKIDPSWPAAAFLIHSLVVRRDDFPLTIWEAIGYWRHTMIFDIEIDKHLHKVEINSITSAGFTASIGDRELNVRLVNSWFGRIVFELNEHVLQAFVSVGDDGISIIGIESCQFHIRRFDELSSAGNFELLGHASDEASLFAPMPGKVIKLNVKQGDQIKRGTVLLVVEAMKMENNIVAPDDAFVEKINVQVGDMVDTKTQMIQLKEIG